MQILLTALITTILKYSNVSGEWMSTMLPLPRDLELLLDSMYNDGYSAEYLVKYDDISEDDLAQSDLLLGWEKPMDRRPADNPTVGIIDPDRDGARNQPPWMNFSKAVFVPNEIDYKIRSRHRYHPHNGKIEGALQKQVERYHSDNEIDINIGSSNQVISSTPKPRCRTSTENLDFLLPIPEYGSTTKPNIKSNKKVQSPKAQKSLINTYAMPQHSEMHSITPGPELVSFTQRFASGRCSGPSLLGLVDKFKKKFKAQKKYNSTDMNRFQNNEFNTLEELHAKLLQMRDRNEYSLLNSRISEEEKQLNQLDESCDSNAHMKRVKAMKPIITHTRLSRPGHKASYIAHIGPLTLQRRSRYNKGSQ